jgi:hypothetical protein
MGARAWISLLAAGATSEWHRPSPRAISRSDLLHARPSLILLSAGAIFEMPLAAPFPALGNEQSARRRREAGQAWI